MLAQQDCKPKATSGATRAEQLPESQTVAGSRSVDTYPFCRQSEGGTLAGASESAISSGYGPGVGGAGFRPGSAGALLGSDKSLDCACAEAGGVTVAIIKAASR